MTRNAAALTILAATGLAAQYIDRNTSQSIHNQANAEMKKQQHLRKAYNFDQSYNRCRQTKAGQQNPHTCETYRINAEKERALAGAVQTIPAQPQQQAPMYTQYNPANAANRQYPPGFRPDAPPSLFASPGQIVQGSFHAIQTGQVGQSFQTDPNLIPDQPAVDYRYTMGGNAGVQNGQSTFGTNVGSGGFQVPHSGGLRNQPYYQRPNPQLRTQPVQRPHQRVRQGRYKNGRIVYQ
jgi:hypothetical protein